MDIVKGKIGNALESVAPNHILGVTIDIYDEEREQYQSDVNKGVGKYIDNPEFLKVYIDSNERFVFGIQRDGNVVFGAGVPKQIEDYVLKKIADIIQEIGQQLDQKVDKEEGKGIIPLQYAQEDNSPEFVEVKLDAENRILWAIKKNGDIYYGAGVPSQIIETLQVLLDGKVDKEDMPSKFIEYLNTPYLYALIDSEDKILCTFDKKDGKPDFPSLKIEDLRTHWFGKSWHAYGTSLTNINNEGKYAKYVSKLSGLVLHNHGISGGSIMRDGESIKGAIFNDTDGKTTADLVTLECWANDGSANFGDITDTGNTTFLGNLAQCIMHLQEVTKATIVIMISTMPVYALRDPSSRYLPTKVYNGGLSCEMADKMRQLCDLYGVYFINPNKALGNYRGGDKYIKDNIHHTELGGLVFARYIWSQLKNLPQFDTEVNI